MKKTVLVLGALAAFAAAQAQAETVIADTDGNGTWSYEEMLAAFPDMTEDAFGAADTDGDGELSADEVAAAREAGTIPA
jgi:hypothetical protein